jgi:hypothetical protein
MTVPNEPDWWPATEAVAVAMARRLKEQEPDRLFVLLARAALTGQWQIFIGCLSAVCDISERGLAVMLENLQARGAWVLLYKMSGMPPALSGAFWELVQLKNEMDKLKKGKTIDTMRARAKLLRRFKRDGLRPELLTVLKDRRTNL